jgi:CBS-domain-containing membrane protein
MLTYRFKGASAVLVYGAIESPLAQPRALLGGHFIASLIGVCITKLFSLLHDEQRFDELRWLAGSLSTATAIVAMQITETTHPPAGASALLAAVSPDITELGWLVTPRFHPPVKAEPSAQVLHRDHPAFVVPHPCRRFDC